jgi:glycosyltransferase involved in cell wall biosynthesis
VLSIDNYRKGGDSFAVKRRVLHLIYSLYRGGAERVIETQILGADRTRFELFVCALTSGGDLIDRMAGAGARVFLIRKLRRGDITAITKLANLIQVEKIDLLHLHNSPGAFWGTLAQIMSGTGVPIVRTEHNPYVREAIPRVYAVFYHRFIKRACTIICVSEHVRRSYVESFPDQAGKYVTILNGIRVQDFEELPPRAECRSAFKLAPGVKLIGAVGRMSPVKNHRLLIEALFKLRAMGTDVHLAIIGEGELREHLAAYAADLGVSEYVSLVRETRTISEFYGALDVFCLSSDSEGIPLTILEAMAAGVPVVSTNVGGISEIVTDAVNGHLVPKGSSELLAKRIGDVLADPAGSAELARRGRELVRTSFTAQRMIRETEHVYEEVLRQCKDGNSAPRR